jgi:hypothetical protein
MEAQGMIRWFVSEKPELAAAIILGLMGLCVLLALATCCGLVMWLGNFGR